MSGTVELDALDVELVLAIEMLREHDEIYVTPGEVFKYLGGYALRELKTLQATARKLRNMESRGIIERDRWVKRTRYREAVGVVAAIDRARGNQVKW